MLEKSLKKVYFDAHFHLADCISDGCDDFFEFWSGCSCFHSQKEWEKGCLFLEQNKGFSSCDFILFRAFGIHPQIADKNVQFDFLENLCQLKQICAIGECGFDFFTSELLENAAAQETAWNTQLDLAQNYGLPLIIHCRKANQKLFEYSDRLKKLPAVLLHSFMGSPVEAKSLLNRGINGFFSFGKQLMNNNKKAIACFNELPLENLLCETDAPFQTLKGENHTFVSDIKKVYNAAYSLRKKTFPTLSEDDFFETLLSNARNFFAKS